jgi:hypothetical protein
MSSASASPQSAPWSAPSVNAAATSRATPIEVLPSSPVSTERRKSASSRPATPISHNWTNRTTP